MNSKKIYIYRITHIENIPHILQNGITHFNSPNKNSQFTPIGDSSLIKTRGQKKLENGKLLGNYIPFYFGARSPMLYVVQNGYNGVTAQRAHNIIYIVSSVQKIIDLGIGFIYTDGHATNKLSTFYSIDNLGSIEKDLDFTAIHAKKWKNPDDLDLKRRKEAEFLIEQDLPINAILGYVVESEYAKNKLIEFGIQEDKIAIRKEYYY